MTNKNTQSDVGNDTASDATDIPGRKTVALDTPIVRGGQTLTEITVVKPAGSGWLRGVSLVDVMQMNTTVLSVVLPRITEPALTQNDVLKLDPSDLLQLAAEVSGFLLPK